MFIKKFYIFYSFVLVLILLGSIPSFSQVNSTLPTCVSDQFLNGKRKDSNFLLEEKRMNNSIRNIVLSVNKTLQNQPVYTIPVVFHIIQSNPKSITDQMVIDALQELNNAYAHKSPFNLDPGGVDTKIQFCLARTRPDGSLTTGIDRATTFYGQHDMDMEGDKPASLMNWDPSKYINIWLGNRCNYYKICKKKWIFSFTRLFS
jgi:hypothetical protein